MRIASRVMAGALLASAFVAAPVMAQGVTYTTSGVFGGPVGCTTNVCSGGGYTLTYLPVVPPAGMNIGNGSITTLGNFVLQGTGNVSGSVPFTLAIMQSQPTPGTFSTVGSVSGTVTTSTSGNVSTLVYRPGQQVITIGPVTYTLIYDNIGPGAGVGFGIPINNAANPRGLQALVTTTAAVPEPASMTLLATGLVGIFGAARRRRKATA